MAEKSCLYVVELEPVEDPEARWYVGISETPRKRWKHHRSGNGAQWTQRNRVVDCYEIAWYYKKYVRKMEKHLTAMLMDAYGKDSTRGAKYLSPELITYPRTDTDAMPPNMVEGLRESGNADLARIATKPRIYVTVSKAFRSTDEAQEWAEETIAGRETITVEKPVDPREGVVDWDPDEYSE